MENPPTFLTVVAAAIRDPAGRLLMQQVPVHKRHGGRWEFPGGKVESDENQKDALCREVAEELGLQLFPDAMELAGNASETAADGQSGLVLFLYNCLSWRGEPQALEQQNWGWFTPQEARALSLPPMDRALLEGMAPDGAA